MGKHAYLIMAHKDDFTFRTLLKLLDDERNHLFIHMDAKNRGYDSAEVESLISGAGIIHVNPRKDVHWGGYNMIEAEVQLLQTATEQDSYDFYHLISGEDLPIKTQDEIHNFFDSHDGKEFVQFQSDLFSCSDRVRYYHSFQERLGRGTAVLSRVNELYLLLQKVCGICRNKDIVFQKGTNWFSITDALARYVVQKQDWIRTVFRSTVCADEIFLQTLVVNSAFRDRLYHPQFDNSYDAIVRHIDWDRSDGTSPYIFRMCDAQELKNCSRMFARKFNCEIDKAIIEYVAAELAAPNGLINR